MAKENLNVNGEVEECTVVPIDGDGACLFRALSYLTPYCIQRHIWLQVLFIFFNILKLLFFLNQLRKNIVEFFVERNAFFVVYGKVYLSSY